MEEEVASWFQSLVIGSIIGWNDLITSFKAKYDTIKISIALIKELSNITSVYEESIVDYNARFTKTHNSIKLNHTPDFDPYYDWYMDGLNVDMSYMIKYKIPINLINIKRITLVIKERLLIIEPIVESP